MTQRKLALLIGIDRYRYSVQSGYSASPIFNLAGSVADADSVRALLQVDFNFDSSDILTLTNEEATHRGILDAVNIHLVARAQPEDNVVFYFSGHGSYRIGGADRVREGTLVPHDARPPSSDGLSDLGGSELASCFKAIPSRNFTLVLDCCHSGQLISARGGCLARGIPPEQVNESAASAPAASAARGLAASMSTARFALLTAAAPNELAWERMFDGRYGGAFTYFLTRQLRSAGGSATYRQVMDNVRGMVNSYFALQNPQLEGDQADQFVFGAQERRGGRYVVVRPDNGRIRVDAGQVHGITAGSRYAVYENDDRPPEHAALSSNVEIEIEKVGAITAYAKQISGSPIAGPSRAIETAASRSTPQVIVSVTGMADLEATLRHHPHLQIRSSSNDATPVDVQIIQKDGIVECEVTGLTAEPNGRVRLEPPLAEAAHNRASLLRLCEERVLHWAKWLNLLRLESNHPLRGVGLELSRMPAAGGLERAAGEYYDHEHVDYVIENQSDRDIFVSLLSFGDDGSVTVVYPAHDGPSRALPRGGRYADSLDIELPADKSQELNFLKVFATLQACDFHLLTMQGYRGSANALEQLFEAAAFGTRMLKPQAAVQEWSTAQSLVRVRRQAQP